MRMLPRRPGAWLFCAGALVALPVACSQSPVEDGAVRDEDGDQTDDEVGEGGGRGGQPAGNAGTGGRGGAGAGSGGSAGGAGGGSGGAGGSAGAGGSGETRDAGTSTTPDASAPVAMSTLKDESIVWDGDGVGNGGARQWMGRGQEGKTTLSYSTASAKSPTHSVAFALSNIQYGEFGWGFRATPANKYKYIAFWVNMVPSPGKTAPGDALVTVRVGGGYAAPGGGRGVHTIKYNKYALQGGWKQVVIPVADIVGSTGANIDELLVGLTGCGTERCGFTLYVDDIAFGN